MEHLRQELVAFLAPAELEALKEMARHRGWPIFLRLSRKLAEVANRGLLDCSTFETYKEKSGFAKGVMHLADVVRTVYDIRIEEGEANARRSDSSARGPYEPEPGAESRAY